MHEEPQRKTELQHTTTVWYGGSCTNKHDKLMDTSIQVLSTVVRVMVSNELSLLMLHILLLQWFMSTMPQTMNGKDYG